MTANVHWNEEGMNRRLKAYREVNEGEDRKAVWGFFAGEIEDLEENETQPRVRVAELIVDEKQMEEEEGDDKELRLNLNGDELKIWELIVKKVESVSEE